VNLRTSLLALSLLLSGLAFAQQPLKELSSEEYKVLAAALEGFRAAGMAHHPMIAAFTSTSQCTPGCNGFEMNGCNGLRSKNETMGERLAVVKRDLPKLEQATISDFITKSKECSTVEKNIPTESPYFLSHPESNEKLPSGWEHPDFVFVSRVGLNGEGTQALVNISFASGTNAGDSGGKYFLFVKNNKNKWEAMGSSAVWKLLSL